MAKILVADDNSNIQKMVGLALKDQGIDVVAVGNGEAAVRKISDIRPDLVLADVFMPVRNGYEVCKYVKDDPALSHIPVILLVGAFDPLDEQEAQRVGADGVLKKPFVPPDPLISMVKSALARAGVLASEKVAEAPPIKASDMIGTPVMAPVSVMAPTHEYPSNGDSVEQYQRKPDPVRIDSGAPLAFGSLLETPVVKEEEEDQGFVGSVQPELSTERDWRSLDESEEVEEDEEPKSSWRRGGDNEALEEAKLSSAVLDWRDTTLAEMPNRHSSRGAWEPTKEKTAIVEAAEEPVSVASTETSVAPTPISVSTPSSAPAPFAGDAWAAAISAGKNEESGAASISDATAEVTSGPVEVPSDAAEVAVETVAAEGAQPEAKTETVSIEPSMAQAWFSPAPSPWDAEIKKASQLTSGWDSPSGNPATAAVTDTHVANAGTAAAEPPAAVVEPEPSAKAVAREAGISHYAFEAIREEAAIVTETATAGVAEPAEATTAAAAEPKMDDLVAKVLARMSPEVLQAVTREILKPVVEAMVRDELNAKKS